MKYIKTPNEEIISLDDLYHNYISKMMLDERIVYQFHRNLNNYFNKTLPTFFIRQYSKIERGKPFVNNKGQLIKMTDNAPIWQIHSMLLDHQNIIDFDKLPCHLFEISQKENGNKYGWHFAHIINVKGKDTDFMNWDFATLKKAMLRSIHPCNYFLIPKNNWRINGSDPQIISFFRHKFSLKYSLIWDEFETSLGEMSQIPIQSNGSLKIEIPFEEKKLRKEHKPKSFKNKPYKRLNFKRDLIENLDENESFEIETSDGLFEMTKKDFYTTFSNVASSKSYIKHGLYHYPKTPKKAFQYLKGINKPF